MESAVKPVQEVRGRRGRWPTETKLAALQEWRSGMPMEEVCRRFGMNAALLYRWKRSVDQGLKDSGELVPRSQVVTLQKRIEELERALGRKTLELEVLKKAFELKGLKLPEGTSGG
jgi:transposase